jgi:hypothetical protein
LALVHDTLVVYLWPCYFQAWQLPSLKAVIGFFIGGLIMAYLIFL